MLNVSRYYRYAKGNGKQITDEGTVVLFNFSILFNAANITF
jgi:hypothetical protein